MRQLTLFLLLIISASGFAKSRYSSADYWYDGSRKLAKTSLQQHAVDVFYVLPTCVFAWADERGEKHFNAAPANEEHRKAWQLSAELAEDIFAQDANFIMPYYRQTTFGTPDETVKATSDAMACGDVVEAFDYYLRHINGGRPFVLAGFSQGAQIVIELMKAMNDKTYERMVAAYVVGYGIKATDTLMARHPMALRGRHRKQHIRLAQGEEDTGVTVCYNSVTELSAVNKSLCGDNIACINPVTWTCGGEPAILLKAGASPEKHDDRFPYGTDVVPVDAATDVTVAVDESAKVLVVSGVDARQYSLPALKEMFPIGNLHLQELFFYAKWLRENVKKRCSEK